jgi:hypothetical protein
MKHPSFRHPIHRAQSGILISAAWSLLLAGACMAQSGAPSSKPVTSLHGEAVYQGLEGTFDFTVPEATQPTRGALSAFVSFKFLIKPKVGAGLKVLPDKCQLLMVQSNAGNEWRMQPAMMEAPAFSTSAKQENGMLVTLRLPLKMGRESSLTLVSGTIAAEVLGPKQVISTGRLEPVKGMKLKLGEDLAVIEAPAVYQDGREVMVVRPDSMSGLWKKSLFKVENGTVAHGTATLDGQVVYEFPGKIPPGEFAVEARPTVGETGIPFTAVVPNRNLFGMMAGLPMEPIPNVTGEILKQGQQSPPVASSNAGEEATPLTSAWQSGEMLRYSVENINDTRMPGDLGSETHVRLRNDLKVEVLELMPNGDARLGLTFERVRVEETEDGEYHMTDTRDDNAEKLAANPWSKIVGQRIEVMHSATDGKVTLVNEGDLVKRLAGQNVALAGAIKRLLRPADLEGLIDNMKPRFSPQSRAKLGSMWRDEMDPRIPLSDFRPEGEEHVMLASGSRIVLGASYQLPRNLPPEKLVGQQLEFKMVGARYKKMDVTRSRDWDVQQKTCTHFSMNLLLLLEGKLGGDKLNIDVTQKSHGWLLERKIQSP